MSLWYSDRRFLVLLGPSLTNVLCFGFLFSFSVCPETYLVLQPMHVFVLTARERAGAELIADAFGGCGVCRLPGSACRSSSPCTCSLGLQPGHQQGPQKGHTC